jgi:hypothetical protein
MFGEHQKETLLYGCKIGQPDYMEEILYHCKGYTNKDELIKKGEKWAKENNYDRLRVHVVNLAIAPDFTKTINTKNK